MLSAHHCKCTFAKPISVIWVHIKSAPVPAHGHTHICVYGAWGPGATGTIAKSSSQLGPLRAGSHQASNSTT